MTIRRKLPATFLAATLTLGLAALPDVAGAAPAAPSYVITGADGLAVYADAALDAWLQNGASGNDRAFSDFDLLRDAVAGEAARRLGLAPAEMQAAWRRADAAHQIALLAALTQLGTKYRRNTSLPGVAFDCSGLTSFAWAQAGKQLPRQSTAQIRSVKAVPRESAQPGDLVQYPGHISMYLGVGTAIIHAPFTGRNIELGFISKSRVNSVRFGNPAG
jgi:cell wall-associated NlpC family hydrolase